MIRLYRIISTCLGIGYVPKGGGTVAAGVCCIVWYVALRHANKPILIPLLITLALLFVGVYSAGKVESAWGKDSKRIVIDEAAGMCLTLLFVPVRWPYLVAGFLLFRFFDIAKPFYIRRMEKLEGGWGVMMDDVLAGVYANLLLQLAIFATSFVKTP
jgi:phosphatidylglycerophosphatase A